MNDLDKLIRLTAKHYRFDAKTYPELEGAGYSKMMRFAIRHSGIHFAKTAGKVIAVSEKADHGEPMDFDSLKENIPKSIVNALRLAELVGMNGSDIVKAVEEQYKDKIE